MSRETDYITEARTAARQLWNALKTLEGLQAEWHALDYSNTLDAGEGENAGITGADVGAVVFAAADTIRAAIDGGTATNICKLL